MGRIDHCKYVYISLVISGFTCHHTASRFLFHEQADIGTDTSMAFFFFKLTGKLLTAHNCSDVSESCSLFMLKALLAAAGYCISAF